MIFGRPTNLWLGLVTAALSFAQIAIVTLVPTADPVAVATLLGGLGLLIGAIIALVANQAPTVKEGATVNVTTPADQENYTIKA